MGGILTVLRRGWRIPALVALTALASGAYLYWLYRPGLILWNPDFLAFTQENPPWLFFPPLYRQLVGMLGEGIVAGRILSGTGFLLAMAALMVPAVRRGRVSFPLALVGLAGSLSAPHLFATALSPSVDMLYTGVAIIALVALSTLVMPKGEQEPLPAGFLVLVLCIYVLVGLRYHAAALFLGMALALVILAGNRKIRRYAWLLLAVALIRSCTMLDSPAARSAREQVWCGLEFRYHRLAAAGVLDGQPRGGDVNGYVWDQYDRLIELSRHHSLLDYYTVGQIAAHIADNYCHFLRRPLVLVGLVLFALGGWGVWRRRDRYLFVLFLLLYPLLLSAAYYTARASLPTELAGLYLALQVLGDMWERERRSVSALAWAGAPLLVLLALAASYPRMRHEVARRHQQLREAAAVETVMRQRNLDTFSVWTEDSGVTIRLRNPKSELTAHAYQSWLDYAYSRWPHTEPSGVVPPDELLARGGLPYRLLIIRDRELAARMLTIGGWERVAEESAGDLYLLVREPSPQGVSRESASEAEH